MSADTSGTLRIEKLPERGYLEKAGVAVHEDGGREAIDYTDAEVEAMRRSGPFTVVPNTQEVRMKFTVGFRTKSSSSVKVRAAARRARARLPTPPLDPP